MESEAFKKAKLNAEIAKAEERRWNEEQTASLAELFDELSAMSADLRRYGVTFEWGKASNVGFLADQRRIFLLQRGRNGGRNVIDFHNGFTATGSERWVTHGGETYLDDADDKTKLGDTAKEAAQCIAQCLVSYGGLPAHGRYRGGALDSDARRAVIRVFARIAFYLMIPVLMWIILTTYLMPPAPR